LKPSSRRPAILRPGARPGGAVRRTKPIRRASAGLTPTRAGALLALLAAVAGLYGAASSDAFAARRTEISGATWTTDDALRAAMAIPPGQNLFVLRTRQLEDHLAQIPAVLTATVTAALPDEVRVTIQEREPLLAWKVGERRFLVDQSGLLFAELGDAPPPGAASLPVIDDRRASGAVLAVGSSLDSVSLDAALRIGSLTPADVGSAAQRLDIAVDDTDGFTVRGQPVGWTAIFGFYTPTLRPTDLIPGQVRLLRSLILGREDTVLRVILADDRSGTYMPRPTPVPSKSPTP
jgi:cell division septal protein FtsQ